MMRRLAWLAVVMVGCSASGESKPAKENNEVVGPNACEGASPIPSGATTCRSVDDCSADERCLPDADSGDSDAAPGISCEEAGLCDPMVACEADTDCMVEGEICRRYTVESCCGPVVENYECRAACEAGECEAGERCNEDDGQCYAIPCEEPDYECPTLFTCAPERDGADRHGCVLASCDLDGIECPGSDDVCAPERSTRPNDCAPRRCEDGYECGENEVCDEDTDGHGCRKRDCSDDADCDCGACVNGQCEARLFVCVAQ